LAVCYLLVLSVLLAGCKEDNSKETTGTNKGENKAPTSVTKKFIPTEYDSNVTVNVDEKTLTGALNVKATNH
jgi:hypothetical protein